MFRFSVQVREIGFLQLEGARKEGHRTRMVWGLWLVSHECWCFFWGFFFWHSIIDHLHTPPRML